MKIDAPGMDAQWMKMPTSEDIQQSFNMDIVGQEMGPLEDPVEIEYLRSESVDGIDCNVFSVTPDMKKLGQLISEQQGSNEYIDWEELATLSDVFKEFTYLCYITTDSNMLKKVVMDMEMEFTPEQAGASAGDFDKMKMNISVNMKIYDHNVNFSITLPAEASSAQEVSEDMFSE